MISARSKLPAEGPQERSTSRRESQRQIATEAGDIGNLSASGKMRVLRERAVRNARELGDERPIEELQRVSGTEEDFQTLNFTEQKQRLVVQESIHNSRLRDMRDLGDSGLTMSLTDAKDGKGATLQLWNFRGKAA